MTPFQKAFSQARAQQGAGGKFDFQGKQYTTDTADDQNQLQDSRNALEKAISSGDIVDNSGEIGQGMVESGKMTQDQFNKSFSTEKVEPKMDLSGLAKLTNALKPTQTETADAYRFGDVGASVQLAPNNMAARRAALMAKMGGGQ
jgi:hypothetical protein